MRHEFEAVLLRIHLSEDDRSGDRPLHEAILDICRTLDIGGVTGFRGLTGFHGSEIIHRKRAFTDSSAPVVLTMIDTEDNIQRLQQELAPILADALVLSSRVRAIRLAPDTPRNKAD